MPASSSRPLRTAIADGAARAGEHYGVAPASSGVDELPVALARWASAARLDTVAAMRPFVGSLADRLEAIAGALETAGVRLVLMRRPEDVAIMNRATAGFFRFWKATSTERQRSIGGAAPIGHA